MGQYWKVINVDKRQCIVNNGGLTLWEILVNRVAEPMVGLLQVPQSRSYKLNEVAIVAARSQPSTSELVALPQELVDAIAALLGDDLDIVCLALTSSYVFRLLAPKVRAAVIRDEAPWAGDRVIVVGDYATGVPEGLLMEHELSRINTQVLEERREYGEDEQEVRNPLYEMETQEVDDRREGYRIRRLRDRRLSSHEMDLLDRLLHPGPHPPAQEAVLRNLDTQEYVRDLAIAESQYAYSLGEVVCSHAPWTEYGSKGLWAGCRFDIATTHDVDADWTDVSERAIDYLRRADLHERADGKRAVTEVGLRVE